MSRTRFGLVFAGLIAMIGLSALTIELVSGLTTSFERHRSLAQALYLHFRFFTILTNWGVVLLLLATIVQAIRGRLSPRASFYGAALVYILVVGVTYEILLRRFGVPKGIFFVTDAVIHDIVPAFYLAFWLGFAPKRGLDWRSAITWLIFPAAYLAGTLIAGLLGVGYPYFFLDVAKLGYGGVLSNALLFLLVFFLLGIGAALLSRALPAGGRT